MRTHGMSSEAASPRLFPEKTPKNTRDKYQSGMENSCPYLSVPPSHLGLPGSDDVTRTHVPKVEELPSLTPFVAAVRRW